MPASRARTALKIAGRLFAILAWLLAGSRPELTLAHQSAQPDQPPLPDTPGWRCWDPATPNTCHTPLLAVDMLTATDGWAAGANGILLRWNGSAWQTAASPVTWNLNAIKMVSSTDGWAVGNGGTIVRWNGTQWTSFPSPVPTTLYGLDMLSATEGWAVGSKTLHWDGSTWTVVPTPVAITLNEVDMLAPNDVWAAGDQRILHWNGSAWVQVPVPANGGIRALAMVSATDGWVGLSAFNDPNAFLHWDGSSWQPVPIQPGHYWRTVDSLAVVSANNIWAAGNEVTLGLTIQAEIHHWDGVQWSKYATIPQPVGLQDLSMLSATDGVVVGDANILRWNGTNWQYVVSTSQPLYVNDLSLPSSTDGWAVGQSSVFGGGGPGRLWHWDGQAWTLVQQAPRGLNAIKMLSATQGWVVGSPCVLLYLDGATWLNHVVPGCVEANFVDVDALSAEDIWVLNGTNALHWDGQGWQSWALPSAGFPGYRAIDVVTPTDVWTISQEDRIAHWDGQNWASVPNPALPGKLFGDIQMLSATDGWIVGDLILHWDGAAWTTAVPNIGYLTKVHMLSATEGWATGTGRMAYWNGTAWTTQSLPTEACCTTLVMLAPNQGWAAGGGVWMRYGLDLTVASTQDAADAMPGDGRCASTLAGEPCTLRAALQEANAIAGPDVIVAPPGTYALTLAGAGEDQAAQGDLDVTDPVAILGAGPAGTRIDGAGLDRVVHVVGPYTVTLQGLSITSGQATGAAGGGVLNAGNLTLTDVVVNANTANVGGGLATSGPLTLDRVVLSANHAIAGGGLQSAVGPVLVARSVITGNQATQLGGGIALGAGGTLTLTESSVISNTAPLGAGLLNNGALHVEHSTLSANLAALGGGALWNDGPNLATLVNSTISGNRALGSGGGLAVPGGTVALANTTVAFNHADLDGDGIGEGGGVWAITGTLTARNSLLAANVAPGGQSPDCKGSLVSQGYNLVEDPDGCTVLGDLAGVQTGVDPLLEPLQDNFGPTATHALPANSPAVDAGRPTGCIGADSLPLLRDQRNFPRPSGPACDLGAYEFWYIVARIALPLLARNP